MSKIASKVSPEIKPQMMDQEIKVLTDPPHPRAVHLQCQQDQLASEHEATSHPVAAHPLDPMTSSPTLA